MQDVLSGGVLTLTATPIPARATRTLARRQSHSRRLHLLSRPVPMKSAAAPGQLADPNLVLSFPSLALH